MKKIYFLKNCSTCLRIIKEINPSSDFIFQDLKTKSLTSEQLESLYNFTNSYEALFNKRAKLYKEMGLRNNNLQEQDYKHYLLQHYTFLKRPVIVIDTSVFIGNSKKVVTSITKHIAQLK
jgi:arsenate reductase (glutaredoxin)